MGTGPYRRKKRNKGDHPIKEKYRTKRKTKDMDEIQDDMNPAKVTKLMNQDVDEDKPGSAQHYCVHCAKYLISEGALKQHFRGKPHKRRVKNLQLEAHSQDDAERAAGMGSYKAPKPFNTDLPVMDTEAETTTNTELESKPGTSSAADT